MFEVKLSTVDEVKEFVNAAMDMKTAVRITALNNTIVDASSVLGILSLNLSNPLVLNCENEEEANEFLSKWRV